MKRPSKRSKVTKRGSEPKTVLRLKDKLFIFGFFAAMLLAGAGGIWMHRAKHDAAFERNYHLHPAQMKQVKALQKEHERIYPEIKKRAEASREELEMLVGEKNEITPAVRALLDRTNTLREACWIEELRYCRAVSALMTPDDARRYLVPLEKRFAARKPDARGFLNIPHN